MDDNRIELTQRTGYPWQSGVSITVEPEEAERFAVLLRIPGWAQDQPVPSDLYKFQRTVQDQVRLKVNGDDVALTLLHGYARIERVWQKGDLIELNLPMPVRRIISHANIVTNQGKVALQRGPIVYCLEGPDNEDQVLDLYIPHDAPLRTKFRRDLLNGVITITGRAKTAKRTLDGQIVPHASRAFTAIPYYAWAHRGRAPMTVWPGHCPMGARPRPADTLTYISKTTASFVHVSLDAIKDQVIPANSGDSSGLQLDFWPHKDVTEWLQFEWDEQHTISSVKIYWFDDTGRGACHLPAAWKVLYRDAQGDFKSVDNSTTYGLERDCFNRVRFNPIKTDCIKIEIQLQKDWAAGVQEVVIE